jgi:hypothetical protein
VTVREAINHFDVRAARSSGDASPAEHTVCAYNSSTRSDNHSRRPE